MASSIHAEAINLARRHSMRNENDFLQENLFDDDAPLTGVTEKYCASLLSNKQLPQGYEVPEECHKYGTFRAHLQKRQSNRQAEEEAAIIAFAGMNPNEALEAMRARESGRPHHAQIKRRMTSNNPQKQDSSWF